MRRLLLVVASAAILLLALAPAALAAEPASSTGSVAVTVRGTVDVPAGASPDLVLVVDGTGTVSGDADTVVVLGGTATIDGASVDHLVVVDGTASLVAGARVTDSVTTLRGTVSQADGSVISGRWNTLEGDLVALGVLLVPLLLAFAVGMAIAGLVAALLVAAFGARQVRQAEALISDRPGQVLVTGIAGMILLPLVAGLLILTVIGAPVGLAILFAALPVLAFLAWLVAAIWIGDWIMVRARGELEPRPYRAALVGVVLLALAGTIPLVSGIATVFGLGAILLGAWRVLRPEQPAQPTAAPGWVAPTPAAG